jgi:hypothetical protein
MGEMRHACRVLVGVHEGDRSLGTLRCRWSYNIRTNLKEIGWESVDGIHLARIRDNWRGGVEKVIKLGCHKIPGVS